MPRRIASAIVPAGRCGRCGTQAMRRRQRVGVELGEVGAADEQAARPPGRSKPSSRRAIVLLPAPLGPTSATRSPGAEDERDVVEDEARRAPG